MEEDASIYKVIEIVGTSKTSWDEAARNAIEYASQSLRGLRIAEVEKFDIKIDSEGELVYRTRINLSFKFED